MNLWQEIQWTVCLEETYHGQDEIFLRKWMWWKWEISFVASNGWVNNFMRPYGCSLHRKTTTAQQDPERLIDKLVLYILHARRLSIKCKCPPSSIIKVDETSVWNGMVSNSRIAKQRAKSVCLKTTRHEKYMVSVCLAAKADETKLKPFVVFRVAK